MMRKLDEPRQKLVFKMTKHIYTTIVVWSLFFAMLIYSFLIIFEKELSNLHL